jgi:hypothetical protein
MRNLWLRPGLALPTAALVFLTTVSTPPGPAAAAGPWSAVVVDAHTGSPIAPAAVAFTCPAGAQVAGDAPPRGDARWCEKSGPSGVHRHGPYMAWHPSGAKKEEGEYRDATRTTTIS